jgi:hypothetical protein
MEVLRSSWPDAIEAVPPELRARLSFPNRWSSVQLTHYNSTFDVFDEADPVDAKRDRDQKIALVSTAVILILAAAAYLYGKRRRHMVVTPVQTV